MSDWPFKWAVIFDLCIDSETVLGFDNEFDARDFARANARGRYWRLHSYRV